MFGLIRTFNNGGALSKMFSTFAAETVERARHRIPKKRASKLRTILQREEYERLRDGRKFGGIKPGDSVQIDKLPFMSSKETDTIKGMVIGVVNRKSDTSLKLLNVEFGTPVHRRVVLYSPLHKNVKVLQKAALHNGKKRVKRAKLYYLADRKPDMYTVK